MTDFNDQGGQLDTKKRSIVKSATWRVIGVVMLGGISYAITRSWKDMTVITFVFHSIRLVLYYFHERVWEHITWGKIRHPLADLAVQRELAAEDLEIVRKRLQDLGYIE